MKIENGNLASGITRLLLASLVLFACVTLFTESVSAQRPATTPIQVFTHSAGEPERVELGGGKYKLVYKNKDGLVLREEEYAVGALVNRKQVIFVFPNGKEAEVVIFHYNPARGETSVDRIHYDEFGKPQDRKVYDSTTTKSHLEKWNQKTRSWEPAPERERWNPHTGEWEKVPESERFNPKTGKWEYVPPSNTALPSDATDKRAAPDNARANLDSMDGIKRSTSANPGFEARNTVANGLSVATFITPQGTIYVNLPSDMATGDTLSGTVVAQPKAEDPKQRSRLERELSEYVIRIGQQQIPISVGSVPLQFLAPSAATFLTLIDKKGNEVCRSEMPVTSALPAIGDFKLPTLGAQGQAIEILGIFDGKFETTRIQIGGQDMQLLAESPRRLFFRNTSEQVGLNKIELREGDQLRQGTFRSLGIRLSAPKLNLLRGEGTTLTIVVTGLEDLRESVPLVIENKSPGVISMAGGVYQTVMIAPDDVRQGTYTTERGLTGITPGGFTITGTVTRKD